MLVERMQSCPGHSCFPLPGPPWKQKYSCIQHSGPQTHCTLGACVDSFFPHPRPQEDSSDHTPLPQAIPQFPRALLAFVWLLGQKEIYLPQDTEPSTFPSPLPIFPMCPVLFQAHGKEQGVDHICVACFCLLHTLPTLQCRHLAFYEVEPKQLFCFMWPNFSVKCANPSCLHTPRNLLNILSDKAEESITPLPWQEASWKQGLCLTPVLHRIRNASGAEIMAFVSLSICPTVLGSTLGAIPSYQDH